ncbi:acyloxyacyl hydrolase [Brevundimonas sp. 2R-24]|uniref:Acyloxyacyl hydrolase n=1 Tax=Peiella sedimenti TaxID=3061083 RepID=A0ABT8SMK8_9CAUL|nr:acyloxyacyl hydrolase [Caulobacteraceae bacterium XZ-24]
MKHAVVSAAAAALAMGAAGAAAASEGWVGVYAHDVTFVGETLGLGAAGKEGGANIHLGWRSERLDNAPDWMGGPRVHAFISANTEGDTSYAAVGLNWHVPLGDSGTWYLRPGFGLAYHDGWDEFPDWNEAGITTEERDRRIALRSERIEFGSKVLFEPELAFGARLSENTSIELSYVHLSNGQIFAQGKNQGLDEVGIRLVHRFGR